jgi:hypothetical protein
MSWGHLSRLSIINEISLGAASDWSEAWNLQRSVTTQNHQHAENSGWSKSFQDAEISFTAAPKTISQVIYQGTFREEFDNTRQPFNLSRYAESAIVTKFLANYRLL